ncbi:hypothetical protein PR202_gb11888 [Eleusine coracana subsp. coracana]|uniref:Uncharacterized protein n=1 Tax=Eleusine coracana subsp. coracana TaxID=191504 RepID=A0AAV5ELB7_ELECO|nr:hypothetical protein PR202_gb11888 [Eleusine coracana subsp. coracana]
MPLLLEIPEKRAQYIFLHRRRSTILTFEEKPGKNKSTTEERGGAGVLRCGERSMQSVHGVTTFVAALRILQHENLLFFFLKLQHGDLAMNHGCTGKTEAWLT